MIYGVGDQQNYTFGTYDAFVADNPDFGDNHMSNRNLQYPLPMNVTDTSGEVIDMKRSGSGNTDYRLRGFLLNTGRITVVGSGDFEGRGRGPRNSWPIHEDSIGKFPWELDGTSNYNGTEMRCWQKMACIKSSISNDGFSMIGQYDKLYHVGEGSGLDDTRSGTHGTFPTRVGGA